MGLSQAHVPNIGPFWDDPLPAAEHGILHGGQQEALGCQLQHGVDAFQSHLCPLQLQTHTPRALPIIQQFLNQYEEIQL